MDSPLVVGFVDDVKDDIIADVVSVLYSFSELMKTIWYNISQFALRVHSIQAACMR